MEEVKKIMVAIAFSDYSEGIFNYGAMLASKLGAELILANIINKRDVEAVRKISQMGYQVDGEHYIEGVKQERTEKFQAMIDKIQFPNQQVKIVFRTGNPIDELLKIILEEEIDMVVMGPRGRTDLEHVLVGSVAEKLFRRSPVTVVSYRDERHARRVKKRLFGHHRH